MQRPNVRTCLKDEPDEPTTDGEEFCSALSRFETAGTLGCHLHVESVPPVSEDHLGGFTSCRLAAGCDRPDGPTTAYSTA
jgi:hypothetical protein